jgi:glycerol-3-phosphate acyltransferase PlsX
MHKCFELLKNGEAAAVVSAGNSGAFLGVGLLSARRLERCDRPAIATSLPTTQAPTILLDIGANVEVRAAHLVQFALMGAAYSKVKYDLERPTVALLSNGSEATKGTDTLREAHRLLTQTHLNYIGFVEGRDIPDGCADVVVTDGFVGNIVLKLCEGIVTSLIERVRESVKSNWLSNMVSPALKKPLESLFHDLDWQNTGGAPLLGLNGVAIVAHGRATPRAITHSIRRARSYAELKLLDYISDALVESAPSELTSTSELPLGKVTGETPRPESN